MAANAIIVIKRVFTVVERVPYNADYYPDSASPEDAVRIELEDEPAAKVQRFAENLAFMDLDDPEVFKMEETVTVEWR